MIKNGMTLPDFFIIGAMKAGTTTVYADLHSHPNVFFPHKKEPNSFIHDRVVSEEGRAELAQLYAPAKADQLCGDASTAYSKRPYYEGVAQRVRQVAGDRVKILYLVREPVARIISHHYHGYTSGRYDPDINRCVRENPYLIAFSRYAMQLEPWLETFGHEAVKVMRFETYVADRIAGVHALCDFLGLDHNVKVHVDKAYNPSDKKPVVRGFWRKLNRARWYRYTIRPLLPARYREAMSRMVLPTAPPRPAPPTLDTVDYIIERVQPDMEKLAELLNQPPFWDLQEVRRRFEMSPSAQTGF